MLNRRITFNRSIKTTLLCLLITLASACQKSQPPAGNASAVSNQTQPATTTTQQQQQSQQQQQPASPAAPPVATEELRAAVTRIYKNAVTVDESRSESYVVGDFNGDNSQDIAIVVKPGKGMLTEINSEYANWILEDPHSVMLIDAHKEVQPFPKKAPPVAVRQSDELLAVIHGHQEAGWRNPKATQTYLLKNVVGTGMQMERARSLVSTIAEKEKLPPLRGDVIRETLAGTPGFIYWTGAKYAWHSAAQSQ